MPPSAVKKNTATHADVKKKSKTGEVTSALPGVDVPEKMEEVMGGETVKGVLLGPKEGVEKKEKKEKKEVKDKAEGTFKITSFFTKKPSPSTVPATPAPATPVPATPVPATPVPAAEECITVDSDTESPAEEGSNTPPTAMKKAENAKKDGEKMALDEPASPSNNPSPAPETSCAKSAKGEKAKMEMKKKGGRPAKSDSKDAKAREDVAKGRQGKLCFQPEDSSRQATLDMGGKTGVSSIKAAFSSVPIKPKKERPPHPVGTHIEYSSQFVTTLQFCNSFSEPLEIEAVSMEDFENGLTKFPDDVLSQMHMGLLYTILMNSTETKDEVNFLDADTWPEILRQHLEDAHGKEGYKARELALVASDYAALTKQQRLDIFEVLVDDCLGTETIKNFIDGSLEKLDDIRREEQMDILTDKYKKIEGETAVPNNVQAGEMMAFVTVEEPALEDLDDGKTTRQRALERQREEEAREKRLADEKRMREEKRLADDVARKKAVKDRKDRAEQRVLDLAKVNAQVRAPQVHTSTNMYVVVDCLYSGQRRVLFSDAPKPFSGEASSVSKAVTDTEQHNDKISVQIAASTFAHLQPPSSGHPEWQLLAPGAQVEQLLQHYGPAHSEDKGDSQRRLKEMLPAAPPTAAQLPAAVDIEKSSSTPIEIAGDQEVTSSAASEQDTATGGKLKKHKKTESTQVCEAEGSGVEDVQSLLMARVKDLILDLDDCTPEDMFTNFPCYIKIRNQWRQDVACAVTADGLKGPLLIFEEAMKHCKMRQGWAASSESGNQRAVWIKDIGAATTPSQMLYQVKVLTWFIGRRQKARSSLKIAPIFSCEMRLTRARAGIVKPSRAAKEADERVEVSSGNDGDDVEDEEEEWEDQEGSDDEAPRRNTRSTRASGASRTNTRSTRSSLSSQAPATRKSSRATRASKRNREYNSSSQGSSDENSDVKRVTRQRVTRGTYALDSDSES